MSLINGGTIKSQFGVCAAHAFPRPTMEIQQAIFEEMTYTPVKNISNMYTPPRLSEQDTD